MDTRLLLVIFVTLVVASAFLFLWRRRDERGSVSPRDRTP